MANNDVSYFTVEVIWKGQAWLEPATGIKLSGVKATSKGAAGSSALALLGNRVEWVVMNIVEER